MRRILINISSLDLVEYARPKLRLDPSDLLLAIPVQLHYYRPTGAALPISGSVSLLSSAFTSLRSPQR